MLKLKMSKDLFQNYTNCFFLGNLKNKVYLTNLVFKFIFINAFIYTIYNIFTNSNINY